jgi:hypothetical protein
MPDQEGPRDAGSGAFAQEHERKRQLHKEVTEAVRTRAEGPSLEAQLDLLSAELRARDLDVAPRPFLDVELDRIIHPDEGEQRERVEKASEVATGFAQELVDLLDGDEHEPVTNDPSPLEPPRSGKSRKGKPRRKGTQHRPQGGLPMMPDTRRTTEVLLHDEGEELFREHQEPPLPQPPADMPLLGSMLRFSELTPPGLSFMNFGSLRLRPTKDKGLALLLAGRDVGVVKDEVAAEFLAHLRGGPPGLRQDMVMGVRYIDRDGSVHLWLYLARRSPGDPEWVELSLKERVEATSLLQCAVCGLSVGKAVRRTLVTIDNGLLRSGCGISLHERCLPEVQARAEAEGLSLEDLG